MGTVASVDILESVVILVRDTPAKAVSVVILDILESVATRVSLDILE